MHPPTARWRMPFRLALSPGLLLVQLAACGATESGSAGQAETAADTPAAASVDLVTAERIVTDYFEALQEGRILEARDLLAAGPRSDVSPEEMELAARAVQRIHVRQLQPVETRDARVVFLATLDVVPNPAQPSGWSEGENTRWVEVVHGWRGWRIGRITSSPVAEAEWSPVTVWSHIHIVEAELSLELPNDWVRRPNAWAWSPPGDASVWVGVRWEGAESPEEPGSLLPSGARTLRNVPLELNWGSGTMYTVETAAPDAAGEAPAYEMVAVIRSVEGMTYGIFARAGSTDELRTLQPVLRRMFTSAEPLLASADALRATGRRRRP